MLRFLLTIEEGETKACSLCVVLCLFFPHFPLVILAVKFKLLHLEDGIVLEGTSLGC